MVWRCFNSLCTHELNLKIQFNDHAKKVLIDFFNIMGIIFCAFKKANVRMRYSYHQNWTSYYTEKCNKNEIHFKAKTTRFQSDLQRASQSQDVLCVKRISFFAHFSITYKYLMACSSHMVHIKENKFKNILSPFTYASCGVFCEVLWIHNIDVICTSNL